MRPDGERRSIHALKLVFALSCVSGRVGAQTPLPIVAPTVACASLRELRLPDVRYTEVVDVPDSMEHGDRARAPHCRVSGVIGKEIAFTALLPNHWNQRLLMGG